jgi:tRNA-splicing ligase RtcB (3'-phosphate/5'-hydroxy nucleic acid ligase)
MDAWLQSRGVTLVGADLDESPMAYRRLPECWPIMPDR